MISYLDHLVLTVRSIARTVEFYTRVLDMREITFGSGRRALVFGNQKLNLHEVGHELEPKAERPSPGSADLCFIANVPLERVLERLEQCGVRVVEGPVPRTGAVGPITSIYVRDPDSNLIEIAVY